MTHKPDMVMLVAALAKELSTELDLHYEDQDLAATEDTIKILAQAADALRAHGVDVPEACLHVLTRFQETKGPRN